jgi:hypothetical protein
VQDSLLWTRGFLVVLSESQGREVVTSNADIGSQTPSLAEPNEFTPVQQILIKALRLELYGFLGAISATLLQG